MEFTTLTEGTSTEVSEQLTERRFWLIVAPSGRYFLSQKVGWGLPHAVTSGSPGSKTFPPAGPVPPPLLTISLLPYRLLSKEEGEEGINKI